MIYIAYRSAILYETQCILYLDSFRSRSPDLHKETQKNIRLLTCDSDVTASCHQDMARDGFFEGQRASSTGNEVRAEVGEHPASFA